MYPLKRKSQTEDCESLLVELYNLLESYAPTWYTQELQERLLAKVGTQRTEVRSPKRKLK